MLDVNESEDATLLNFTSSIFKNAKRVSIAKRVCFYLHVIGVRGYVKS
jgi:hypothetical protein